MSAEKSDAIVIRQADWSESSRVVTLFTRDLGKTSCLAKGAKRLKNAFDGALDLLAECRVVFLHKSSDALDILTEAQLIRRFHPPPKSLAHLYGGYYVAELLNALTEEDDPHPDLYSSAVWTLGELCTEAPPQLPILKFELSVLTEIGQIPNFDTCTICHSPIGVGEVSRFWVSQGGLICSRCGHSEYDSTELHPGTLVLLRRLLDSDGPMVRRLSPSPQQFKEIRRLVTATMTHVLGRRPKTLGLIPF